MFNSNVILCHHHTISWHVDWSSCGRVNCRFEFNFRWYTLIQGKQDSYMHTWQLRKDNIFPSYHGILLSCSLQKKDTACGVTEFCKMQICRVFRRDYIMWGWKKLLLSLIFVASAYLVALYKTFPLNKTYTRRMRGSS